MPIMIKELHISIKINPPASSETVVGQLANINKGNADQDHEINQDQLMAECMEQVFDVLKNKVER